LILLDLDRPEILLDLVGVVAQPVANRLCGNLEVLLIIVDGLDKALRTAECSERDFLRYERTKRREQNMPPVE
jgi:hypothetical protein